MNGSPSVKVALFIRNGGSESPCRWFYITGIYIRVCRWKNVGVAGYAEAFSSVQSNLQTSEWYSYFENDVLTYNLLDLRHFSLATEFLSDIRYSYPQIFVWQVIPPKLSKYTKNHFPGVLSEKWFCKFLSSNYFRSDSPCRQSFLIYLY